MARYEAFWRGINMRLVRKPGLAMARAKDFANPARRRLL